MKRTLLRMVILLSIVTTACQTDEPELTESSNRLIVLPSGGKTAGSSFLLFLAGHDGSKCPGCILLGGEWIHENCQGAGSQCNMSASITLQQVGTDITATTTDTFGLTSLDFFNMPARSLSTGESGNNAYLNIPAQLVERDSATLQFTFTGLFYTNKPEYNNF